MTTSVGGTDTLIKHKHLEKDVVFLYSKILLSYKKDHLEAFIIKWRQLRISLLMK